MREIEFRAKDRTGNMYYDWFYGSLDLTTNSEFPHILCEDRYGNVMHIDVDEKTIGQYTGLKDKNKNKIYNGDIVCFTDKNYPLIVAWYEYKWVLVEPKDTRTKIDFMIKLANECEIIGNIYDNPELLGE